MPKPAMLMKTTGGASGGKGKSGNKTGRWRKKKKNTVPVPGSNARLGPAIKEITFDPDARAEYLKSFRCRKKKAASARVAAEKHAYIEKLKAHRPKRHVLPDEKPTEENVVEGHVEAEYHFAGNAGRVGATTVTVSDFDFGAKPVYGSDSDDEKADEEEEEEVNPMLSLAFPEGAPAPKVADRSEPRPKLRAFDGSSLNHQFKKKQLAASRAKKKPKKLFGKTPKKGATKLKARTKK